MEYINGICRTNLDDYRVDVVSKFVIVPRIGDNVAVLYKGMKSALKVVSITHDIFLDKPIIRVELNK